MPGLTDFFPIFRAGRQTDSSGRAHEISTGDLDAIISQYEAAPDRAQCVITHEEMYSPFGYGAIAELRRSGDLLEARCDAETIEPQFAALVEAGRLENRSVRLIPSADGGMRLGHVAFLGAEPPAVEGLAPIRFAAGAALDFGSASEKAWADVREAGRWADLFAMLRRAFARIAPKEDIDDLIPGWEARDADRKVGAAEERARQTARNQGGDEMTQAEFAAEQDAVEKEKSDLAQARAALESERAEFALAGHRRRVEVLIDTGKIVPAQARGLAEFAARLDAAAGGEIEFAAADGAATKGAASEILFGILERGETHALLGGPIAGGRDQATPATAAGVRKAAYAFQAAARQRGEEVDFITAVGAVSAASAAKGVQ